MLSRALTPHKVYKQIFQCHWSFIFSNALHDGTEFDMIMITNVSHYRMYCANWAGDLPSGLQYKCVGTQ